MASHEDAGAMTSHIGTNTSKFVPPRPYSNGAVQIRVGLELADLFFGVFRDFGWLFGPLTFVVNTFSTIAQNLVNQVSPRIDQVMNFGSL